LQSTLAISLAALQIDLKSTGLVDVQKHPPGLQLPI
jgi:hypothetical protein